MHQPLLILLIVMFPSFARAEEPQLDSRETFSNYIQAMHAGNLDVAKSLCTPTCNDQIHMRLRGRDIVTQLQPSYVYTSADRALVLTNPFTTSGSRRESVDVISATLVKQGGQWRIQELNRTTPETLSWMIRGFRVHPDVKLNLSKHAFLGQWWAPCDSTIILNLDGTGSEMFVGPFAPGDDQKPETFTWTLQGEKLKRRFKERQDELMVTSIDPLQITFKKPNNTHWSYWQRK